MSKMNKNGRIENNSFCAAKYCYHNISVTDFSTKKAQFVVISISQYARDDTLFKQIDKHYIIYVNWKSKNIFGSPNYTFHGISAALKTGYGFLQQVLDTINQNWFWDFVVEHFECPKKTLWHIADVWLFTLYLFDILQVNPPF